jgi:hypothetical protein
MTAAGDCDDGVRQAIAIKIIELAKAGERNPNLSCEGGVENFRGRMQMSGEPLARPAYWLGGAFHPFENGTHQGRFPEPRPEPFRAGFLFGTRPFWPKSRIEPTGVRLLERVRPWCLT